MENIFKECAGLSLRETPATRFSLKDQGMIDAPEFVAARVDEIMKEVVGGGFLFYLPTTRRDLAGKLASVLQGR